ncbi:uncharacterized protein LOC136089329 [Hydra vulgaris]|uniref:Uncharacterized protein LOC136089329 n=1 Tax=Hydra vulgaris TaxID=6087 RepID=A0ABM4DAJ3_HYDVU
MCGKECFQVWLLLQIFSIALLTSDNEVVYPRRSQKDRAYNDLDTLNQHGVHDEHVAYKINYKDTNYVLDLKKTEKLNKEYIWLRSFENGTESLTKHYPEHCYYEGKLRGIKESNAFISTCSGGLTGSIYDGKSRFDIIPQDNGAGHFYRNVDYLFKNAKKFKKTVNKGYKDNLRTKFFDERVELNNIEPQYNPFINKKNTRYVEIFVSCDFRMLPTYKNDRSLLIERVLNVYGQVNKGYEAINVRLIVVAIDIQENKPYFQRSVQRDSSDLNSFSGYLKDVIRKTSPLKDIVFDAYMFLSQESWVLASGVSAYGFATLDTMCSTEAISINHWRYDDISFTSLIIGHEFGHNMGFNHFQDGTICLSPNKICFMGGRSSSILGFSNDDMKVFKERQYPCLSNYPFAPLTKVCGNGIREADEICDCGTLEMCERNGDNCCEPRSCVLKASAQCNYFFNPECCQPSCLFRQQGSICRIATNECDLPEYCEGNTATCPVDNHYSNGTSCVSSVKLAELFNGPIGDSSSFISKLSPPITARYLRVIPQKWGDSGYACFKLDVRSCVNGQPESFSLPAETLLKKDNLITTLSSLEKTYTISFKLKPKSYSKGWKSVINLVINGKSGQSIVSVWLHKDGSGMLYFESEISGKNNYNFNSDPIALDGWSSIELSQVQLNGVFTFTANINGKLIHSIENTLPRSYSNVGVYVADPEYEALDGSIKDLSIANIGCEASLLSTLPDSAYTSNSVYSEKWGPSNVLLHRIGYCPLQSLGSWFEIDFGKIVKMETIEMRKIASGDKTTLYNLKYSDNKHEWFDYLESDQKFCFKGSCTLKEASTYVKPKCPIVNEKECSGNGVCVSDNKCVCNNGYDPSDNCNSKFTPINGKWSSWSMWSKCSVPCNGNGIKKRYRFCSNPEPKYGGNLCDGKYVEESECNNIYCSEDGGYTEWSPFSSCSQTCGGGVEIRTRTCINPSPLGDGKDCQHLGPSKEERECSNVFCFYGCDFKKNTDGSGGVEIYMGAVKSENECIKMCLEKRKTYPTINGVTIDLIGVLCYCEQSMSSQASYNFWKSCYLA